MDDDDGEYEFEDSSHSSEYGSHSTSLETDNSSHMSSSEQEDGEEESVGSVRNQGFSGLNQQGWSMMQALQQRSLLPLVENIRRLISQHENTQLLVQLHHTNDFLLTFSETFAEVALNQSLNDFCGLGPVLAELLATGSTSPEVLIAACRCIKVMAEHSRLAARQMVNGEVLRSLVGFLENIEYIDLGEAALDCFPRFAALFPRKCLHVSALNSLLLHIDFFPRVTQLRALKAAVSISKAAKAKDFDAYIRPVLPQLKSALQTNTGDLPKITEVLKLYTNLVSNSNVLPIMTADGELESTLQVLCHDLKDPSTWSLAFQIYANLALNHTGNRMQGIIELSLAQLEAHSNDSKNFNEKSEQLILAILKVLLPLFIGHGQLFAPLPLSMSIESEEDITLYISGKPLVSLRPLPESAGKASIPGETRSNLLHAIDKILINLPCGRDTRTLCVLLAYGICMTGNDKDPIDEEILEYIVEDLAGVFYERRSILALLALSVLSILFEKVPGLRPFIARNVQDGQSTQWQLTQQPEAITKSIYEIMNNLGFDLLMDGKLPIDKLAAKLESMLVKKTVGLGANIALAEKKERLETLMDRVREFSYESDPGYHVELLKGIERIHRYLSQHDQEFSMLLIDSDKANSHPLQQLASVARPLKVSVTAEIDGRRVLSNRLATVDPLSSPLDVLEVLTGRPVMMTEGGGPADVTIDLAHETPPPCPAIDWSKHRCMIRAGEGEPFVANPEHSLLSYALHNAHAPENIFKLLHSLFTSVLEIRVMAGDGNNEGWTESMLGNGEDSSTESSEKSGFQMCVDALASISQMHMPDDLVLAKLVNNRLTGKLARQLRQTLLVVGDAIPASWHRLMQRAPFLFDYTTKVDYLTARGFRVSRYLDTHYRTGLNVGTIGDSLIRLARIRRLKFIIDRDRFDEQARMAITQCAADKRRVLEFHYAGDVGVGLGPTMEFYTTLSRMMQAKQLGLWLNEDQEGASSGTVVWKSGLYPSPMARREDFAFLGLLVARAILDSRLLDLPLNIVFLDYLLGRPHLPSLRTLALVDARLVASLRNLREAPDDDAFAGLFFVHPAHADIELCPHGKDKAVTRQNFDEFLDCLLSFILDRGIREAAAAFVAAFETVLPMQKLRIFSAPELRRLINGEPEHEWDASSILHDLRVDHGYTKESAQIVWLTETFAELSVQDRGRLVQFLTGAPQLPSGGWAQLRPALTVVCRVGEQPDQALPTVMTCANYLKLPRYSSKEVLRQKLLFAIEEGQGSFLLS